MDTTIVEAITDTVVMVNWALLVGVAVVAILGAELYAISWLAMRAARWLRGVLDGLRAAAREEVRGDRE